MFKMSDIPIKNIYYMALYAWDRIKNISTILAKDIEDFESFNDVIVELFLTEVSKTINRGVVKEYINLAEQSKFVKGKINITESLKLIEPNIICHFDEYSENIILNQIIKAVLLRLAKSTEINSKHKKKSKELLPYFANIEEVSLDNKVFDNIIYNRLNMEYKYLLNLGFIIYKSTIPTEEIGKYKFIDIMDNQEQMNLIFEEFLRNFYKIHSHYKVHRRYYYWKLKPINDSNRKLLPRMETDIELTKDNNKIIIDAKYYKNAFASRYEGKKLISNNIYQMKTYLMQNLNQYETLRGIIVYPSNGYEINERFYNEKGYFLEFMTINLAMEWKDIKTSLLEIIS